MSYRIVPLEAYWDYCTWCWYNIQYRFNSQMSWTVRPPLPSQNQPWLIARLEGRAPHCTSARSTWRDGHHQQVQFKSLSRRWFLFAAECPTENSLSVVVKSDEELVFWCMFFIFTFDRSFDLEKIPENSPGNLASTDVAMLGSSNLPASRAEEGSRHGETSGWPAWRFIPQRGMQNCEGVYQTNTGVSKHWEYWHLKTITGDKRDTYRIM